jgi:hypothetical protein
MEYLAERWARMRSLRNRQRPEESSRGVAASSTRVDDNERYNRIEDGVRHARRRNRDRSLPTQTNLSVRPPPTAYREPSARRPVPDTPQTSSLLTHGAVARLEFVPNRPDELLVSPGDYLRVVALYHDGWALCKNNYGGKGMVPTLCLRANAARRNG